MKTTWDINAINLNPATSFKSLWKYFTFSFDLSPFSLTSAFFRIGAFIILVTYLNSFGFIPIGIFWFINVVLSQNVSVDPAAEEHKNSVWLMSFMGLFVPAYFCPEYRKSSKSKKKKLISGSQLDLYWKQCLASLICYIPSLVMCFIIVNYPTVMNFDYRADIILDNFRFNFCIVVVIGEGIVSFFLSLSPRSSNIVRRFVVNPLCNRGRQKNKKKCKTESHQKKNVSSTSNSKDNPSQGINAVADTKSAPKETVFTIEEESVVKGTLDNTIKQEVDETSSPTPNAPNIKENTQDQNVLESTIQKGAKEKSTPKKKPKKADKTSFTEQAIYLIGCWIILGLVIIPVIAVFKLALFTQALHLRSYIFFPAPGGKRNNTIVIEATLVPKNDTFIDRSNETITGITRFIDSSVSLNPRTNAFNNILVMHLNTWNDRRKKDVKEIDTVVAVILIDNKRFSPSAPLREIPRLMGDHSPTIYMARMSDGKHVERYLRKSSRPTISIAHRNDMIPEPEWICNLQPGECIEDNNFNDKTYVTSKKGKTWIKGSEHMTITCHWGDKSCYGNQYSILQSHNYCRGGETMLCPIGSGSFGNFKRIDSLVKYNQKRQFRMSPFGRCASDITTKVPACDRGFKSGEVSGWTNLLGFTKELFEKSIYEIFGRRYCSIYNSETGNTECIFEEKIDYMCCEEKMSCPNNYPQCAELSKSFGLN